MAFASEQELVDGAVRYLPLRSFLQAPPRARIFRAREVKGLFGVPDLIAAVVPNATDRRLSLRSIAFEMKLADWRQGLVQAFRYRSFASVVYVVLDDARVKSGLAHRERFERANVGLIGLDPGGKFTVYQRPRKEPPFSPELVEMLAGIVIQQSLTCRRQRTNWR